MEKQVVYLVSSLAKIFAPMLENEFTRLKDSIQHQGLLDEITLWRGMVIDGYHRLRACLEAGVEPRFHEVHDDADPLEYIVAKQVNRRQMNQTARAAAAFRVSERSRPGRPRGPGNNANLHSYPNRSRAAGMFGVSTRSVATVAKVLGSDSTASPGVRRAVQAGTVTANDAARILDEPSDVQERAMEMVRRGRFKTVKRASNAVNREMAERLDPEESSQVRDNSAGGRCSLHVSTVAGLHRLVPEGTVDAVITFPPSKPDYSAMFPDLSAFAAHALNSSGGMFVLADTGNLQALMDGLKHPDLYWAFACHYRHPGRPSRPGHPHRVQLTQKLVLIYGKQDFTITGGDDLIELPAAAGGRRPESLRQPAGLGNADDRQALHQPRPGGVRPDHPGQDRHRPGGRAAGTGLRRSLGG